VARANKINSIAPPSRESASPVEPVGLATAAVGGVFPNGATAMADPEKASVEPLSSPRPDTIVGTGNDVVDFLETSRIEPTNLASVRRATRLTVSFNIIFLVVAILLVPFTLFGTEWIFLHSGFTGWCVDSLM
jgi:urea-proton symporter